MPIRAAYPRIRVGHDRAALGLRRWVADGSRERRRVDHHEGAAEGRITSVTSAWRRPRKRACRLRPDARPPGERPYKRLATRCFARRSDPAQFAHRARNDAHPPQNTLTSAQPTHRPNRPSTRKPPSQGGAGRRGRSTAPSSTAGAFSDAHATKARVFRPEPSPTPTCAGYVVVALAADDAADQSSSTQFVRIPRNETRADRRFGSGRQGPWQVRAAAPARCRGWLSGRPAVASLPSRAPRRCAG